MVEQLPKNNPEARINDLKRYMVSSREAYFNLLNNPPEKDSLKQEDYDKILQEVKKYYIDVKNRIVSEILEGGNNQQVGEFLLGEVEIKRQNAIDNKLVGKWERFKDGTSKGIEKWDKWGKNEDGTDEKGWKGFGKRFSKTAVSLAMIGAISGFSVESLSKMGIGTASALGGGATSYLARRTTFGLGLSALMAKVPEKKKGWVSGTMIAGTAGLAFAGGGWMAIGAIGTASAVGLTIAKITSRYEKKIKSNIEKVKEGEIKPETLESDVEKMEREMEEALKAAVNRRISGAIIKLSTAVVVSGLSLEAMGGVHDTHTPNHLSHHKESIDLHSPKAPGLPNDYNTNPAYHAHEILNQPDSTLVNNFHGASVTIEHGHGAINGIKDLQAELHKQYPDISKAPQGVQNFTGKDATVLAKELGFYNPNQTDNSALVHAGSVLKIDDHGNILFGQTDSSGHINSVMENGHYHGKMFEPGEHHTQITNEKTEINHQQHTELNKEAKETGTVVQKTTEEVTTKGHTGEVEKAGTNVNKTHDSHESHTTPVPQHRMAEYSYTIGQSATPIAGQHMAEYGYAINNGYVGGQYNTYGSPADFANHGEVLQGSGNYYNNLSSASIGQQALNLSPKDSQHLESWIDYAGNHFHLSDSKLWEACQANQSEVNLILRHDNLPAETWRTLGSLKAHQLLNNINSAHVPDTAFKHVSDQLHLLKQYSGIKPTGIFESHQETVGHYIARAFQKLAENGMLEKFRAASLEKINEPVK